VVIQESHIRQLSSHELFNRTVQKGVCHSQQVKRIQDCQKAWQVPVEKKDARIDRRKEKGEERVRGQGQKRPHERDNVQEIKIVLQVYQVLCELLNHCHLWF
jgi:hypothetical protein